MKNINIFVGDYHPILKNGYIEIKYPENNNHPINQILYIKELVKNSSKYGWKYNIFTYSPYILNALEVFSSKYNIADKCSYYDTFNNYKDCSNNIEFIYEKLARPLQDLENIRYNN